MKITSAKPSVKRSAARFVVVALAAIGSALAAAPIAAAERLTQVRMSIDEDPIVLRLANSLGYFKQEGIEIVPVDLEKIAKYDYLMQEPLTKGQIDASYHWFNHTIFGACHGLPIKAVMVVNDAPGMTVMVANRLKDIPAQSLLISPAYIEAHPDTVQHLVNNRFVRKAMREL
jgi:ABC-type nitrate/sulfonate/bicarbonate transport system substrate-binding protein